jgi:hypothetical protein
VKSIQAFAAGLLLLFALAVGAQGQEQKFEKDNFAITPPDGWVSNPDQAARSGMLATFTKPGGAELMLVGMYDASGVSIVLNEQFLKDYNAAFDKSNGGKFLSGDYVEVLGINSYERKGEITRNGATLSTYALLIPVGTKAYVVLVINKEGDAKPPEVQKCIASFRFLTPSASPTPSPAK